MFERMLLFAVKTWTNLKTPEREGCLKSVHVRRGRDNRIRKLVVYYPKGNRLPEYMVM